MKNKILLLILGICFSLSAVYASDKVHVSIMDNFNTKVPADNINVVVLEEASLGGNILKENDILHCKVISVTKPKRGKRTASFTVTPISYTTDGTLKDIDGTYYGKYASKILSKEEIKNIDAAKVGKKAAITVGNHFVKGVAPVASLAEGMIKNKDGNRIESGVKQVYKDSPLSYVEKGKELELKNGDIFYLVFKNAKNADSDDNTEDYSEE